LLESASWRADEAGAPLYDRGPEGASARRGGRVGDGAGGREGQRADRQGERPGELDAASRHEPKTPDGQCQDAVRVDDGI
jgi:hypothetical protein